MFNGINNYTTKNNDSIFISNFFHKKKIDYNTLRINPDVEEIPTFTFENDKNINIYKLKIKNKSQLVENNLKNYTDYIKYFEQKPKTPFPTPYKVYQEKMRENNNIYNSIFNNSCDNRYNLKRNFSSYDIKNLEKFSEITQPTKFNKINNQEYNKYIAEQKDYLNYNLEVMKNNWRNKFKKKEPDINPYHPYQQYLFEKGKSFLSHNPILNPVNNYNYNKNLEREFDFNNSYRLNRRNNRYNNLFQCLGNDILN